MLKLMHTINFLLHLEVIYMNIFRLCYEIKTIKQIDVIYINFIILKLKICKQRLSYIVFTSTIGDIWCLHVYYSVDSFASAYMYSMWIQSRIQETISHRLTAMMTQSSICKFTYIQIPFTIHIQINMIINMCNIYITNVAKKNMTHTELSNRPAMDHRLRT